MSSKQHYVSRFHLAWFTDPAVGKEEPWVWVGDRSDESMRRRAPKNVGWARRLYPGAATVDRGIERLLGESLEPAPAKALRDVSAKNVVPRELPAALLRYIAWAAARSLSM